MYEMGYASFLRLGLGTFCCDSNVYSCHFQKCQTSKCNPKYKQFLGHKHFRKCK